MPIIATRLTLTPTLTPTLTLGELKRDLQNSKAAVKHLEAAKSIYEDLKHPQGIANVNLALGEL